jgi:hypothetical protein
MKLESKMIANIKIEKSLWREFLKETKRLDTDASKTIRRWIREFLQDEKS